MMELGRESCTICLNKLVWFNAQTQEYTGMDAVLLLPCGHALHEKCINKWLSNHVECPVCRQDLEVATVSRSTINEATISKRTC